MKRFLGAFVATVLLSGTGLTARADEKDVTPILDKAIAALGGQAKLAKAATATWQGKGTLTFNENEMVVKTRTVVEGIDRHRSEFEMEFNGNPVKGVTILNGSKGWRKFGDDLQDLDDEAMGSEKQRAYLQAIALVLPLKGKGFKLEPAPDEKVDGKPAAVIKGTGPDGKTFTLYFDKESGLPVKRTATIKGFQGEEVTEDTTYSDYKEFDGVKRPTKSLSTWDGKPFLKAELTNFKAVDKPETGAFDEPK